MGARREHRVVDIAAQAGLSRATVDRVLHGRDGVRPETVTQVNRAIDELGRQREQVHLSGRTIILDLVMQTPERFAVASRDALEAELRSLRPAVLRARSHLDEHSDPAAAAALLDVVGRKGSHGVILKAPDHPLVVDAVQRLAARGIPTVTFVTDVSGSRRVAYVGMDNVAAGATAAYLVTQWAGRCAAARRRTSRRACAGVSRHTAAPCSAAARALSASETSATAACPTRRPS